MNPEEIKRKIKSYARSIGLAGLAIGPAEPLAAARERLSERISKGYMGHYGFSEGCEDGFVFPERLVRDARSILACALPYPATSESPLRPSSGGPAGLVARFARGRDYHEVIKEKMDLIAAKLLEMAPGSRAASVADTGPLMDRAAAEASGLGWFGKNACFFVPDHGSWVVLGEIITDLALPVDPVYQGHRCGQCEMCLVACPTGALKAPFELDLNLCISHLTQMSGIIPRDLRPLMQNMVYGCDICQEVCPQNEDAGAGTEGTGAKEAAPGQLAPALDLIALLETSNEEFRRTIGRSAAGWIGRNRLRRNACIALGNLMHAPAVPALRRALLHDRSIIVRVHAAWALGRIGSEEARQTLMTALRYETDPDVREEAELSLDGKSDVPGAE